MDKATSRIVLGISRSLQRLKKAQRSSPELHSALALPQVAFPRRPEALLPEQSSGAELPERKRAPGASE